ncbi:hypothetical protein BDZ94DRAFT_1186529 [Collybia nuda]|uniref:MYND-type domain-containing protein n=1 Tax=Collybia nuda TaxID=64659 RepID=A0A9P5YE21_9AGAR|nr:hypothetical protein BDZ94DRAFT_1186529 [Collybia nuda]
MDMVASVFGGLPYFNPMMMINTSGTCATTRLIQCRDFGISMNDISRKFEKSPDDVPDLSRDDFLARKKVINQVNQWCDVMAGKKQMIYRNEWTHILYQYEIVKTAAKRERDWGHLIFTDMTLTRFMLIMVFPATCNCGNFSHHDYDTMTKYHANRFMSLLTYLHHNESPPSWVRATYTTPNQAYKLDPTFLDSHEPPSPTSTVSHSKFPPIFHVTPEVFVPSLLPSELGKIDNLLVHKKRTTPAEVRARVLGSKDYRPDVSQTWKQKNPRQCALYQAVKDKDMMQCSKCKLVHYCGRECQRLAWPTHKRIFKQAPPPVTKELPKVSKISGKSKLNAID